MTKTRKQMKKYFLLIFLTISIGIDNTIFCQDIIKTKKDFMKDYQKKQIGIFSKLNAEKQAELSASLNQFYQDEMNSKGYFMPSQMSVSNCIIPHVFCTIFYRILRRLKTSLHVHVCHVFNRCKVQ
jgi:hypothetical protein